VRILAVQGETSRKDWTFRKILPFSIFIVIVGCILWFFITPLIWYEKVIVSYYYWVINNRGTIGQLVVQLGNNGTLDFALNEVWINDIGMDDDSWTLSGWRVVVFPKNIIFESGQGYNFTLLTSRKHYSFTFEVNVGNTKTEDLRITGCYFYTWPITGPYPEKPYVGIEVNDVSATDLIVKKVWINDTLYDLNPYLWLTSIHTTHGIEILYEWKTGLNYTVTIETAAGSTATVIATAD